MKLCLSEQTEHMHSHTRARKRHCARRGASFREGGCAFGHGSGRNAPCDSPASVDSREFLMQEKDALQKRLAEIEERLQAL